MKTYVYQWLKTNSVMLLNAGSLVATTAITSVLGFAYWWLAARVFPPQIIGLGSAAISAMVLLGTIGVLGLGTLLVGELPRQPGKEKSLISAALLLVGGVGAACGVTFACIVPFISPDFGPLRANAGDVIIFAAGVSLTAITLVLDQALIGLLRGELQLWRNTLFAMAKLVALFVVALWVAKVTGLTIYATWVFGNAISLLALAAYIVMKGQRSAKAYLPQWGLLRKFGGIALQHHLTNLLLQAPTLLLPVLVTILLSATVNAWFYMSSMLAGFISVIPIALATVLYAMNTVEASVMARKVRMTLGLAVVIVIVANCVLLFDTKQVLGLLGHIYVEQAAWSLRILSLGAFPQIIKSYYVAVCRIQDRLRGAMLPIAIGALLELGVAVLGARLAGLTGLSLGWTIGMCIEVAFMFRTVYRAAWLAAIAVQPLQQYTHYHDGTSANEPGFEP